MDQLIAAITELKVILGEHRVLTKEVDLLVYSYDAGTLFKEMPGCVVFPGTTDEVAAIMELACRYGLPVTPRGAGTNQSGGSIPVLGGIVVCFSKMNRILEIDEKKLTATVEPGLVLQRFNLALQEKGLYFPPDPQSFFAATMGGIMAENAGGPVCVKYGVTKQYVLAATLVLPDGRIAQLGGQTMNNQFGYDLLALMIGSEGTLGLVTQATVRLLRQPEAKMTVVAVFDDVETAGHVVHQVIINGVIPSKSEIIDSWLIQKIEEVSPVGFPVDAEAIILFETDGTETGARREAEIITALSQQHGARWAKLVDDGEEADRYWGARRAGFATVFSAAPNVLSEDVVVPLKSIPVLLKGIREISKKHDVVTVVVGHAGDGNMHPDILTDQNDPQWYGRAERAMEEMIDLALSLKGVISGEHGIGLEKKGFLDKSMDSTAIRVSKEIKAFLDPCGVMNPDKIWNW